MIKSDKNMIEDTNMFNKKILKTFFDTSKLSLDARLEDTMINELNMFSKDIKGIKNAKTACTPYVHDTLDFSELRGDIVKKSASKEEITKNSKEIKENCFTVPKIV